MKNIIKKIVFVALLGTMLAGCDGDIDEISMNLELNTTVSGSMSMSTKFDSGDSDTIKMLGALYYDDATGKADTTKIDDGFEIVCTSGTNTITFTVKCTNLVRPVVENDYNDVLREELQRWIAQQYNDKGGTWTNRAEKWTIRREIF